MKRMVLVAVAVIVAVSAILWAVWPRGAAPLGLNSNPGIQQDADGPAPTATAVHVSAGSKATVLGSSSQAAKTNPKAKYLVMFVLDGGRPDYLNVPDIPHVRALIKNGTRYTNSFAGILESETPSGHASLASGSKPARDGILSFAWATNDNIPVNLFDPAKIRAGDMEKITTQVKVPTIASLVKKAYPKDKVVALSGHKYYAADAFGGPNADVIMYYAGDAKGHFVPMSIPGHNPPAGLLQRPGLSTNTTHLPLGVEDHLAMKLAITTFQRMHQQVTLINVPEFDWPLGHVDGADLDPSGVKTLMQGFDRDLGKMEEAYRKAGVLDQTDFVITADHGFAPISHKIDKNVIENAVEAAGTTLVSSSCTTAAYLWLKDGTKSAQAAVNIAHLQNPYIQSVYFKSPTPGGYQYVRASGPALLRAPGVEDSNQYLLNSFNGPNGPDVVAFYTEETASVSGGSANWKGDHGGGDWEAQHIPLVISGPGVRQGYVSSYPAQLMNIAPTGLSLLGANPSGMTGIPLADAMTHPSSALVQAQQSQSPALTAVVNSMKAESQAELTAGR